MRYTLSAVLFILLTVGLGIGLSVFYGAVAEAHRRGMARIRKGSDPS